MKKNIRRIKFLLYILIGRCIVWSVSYLLKKFFKKRYILFIGRDDGKFVDNVKYIYLHFARKRKELRSNGLEILFLTENKDVYSLLKKSFLPVEYFPSFEGLKALLSTRLLIVDNWMWIRKFKGFILRSVKKLQLWHGIAFKYIELMNKYEFSSNRKKCLNKLLGRFSHYEVVISTSPFYTENVFKKAFNCKEIWETGYPRNDIFFRDLEAYDLLFTDKEVLQVVKKMKENGYKIILYAPTFRDTGGDVFSDGVLDVKRLDSFLQKLNVLMVIKFHPDPNFNYYLFENCTNIILYDNDKDVYPLLKNVNCLITDYSSIYMDYLLTDRPIIFFPYDYEKYIRQDRKIQFDYYWTTPGEKAFNQEELEILIKKIVMDKIDNFREKRNEIRKIAFKHQDGAASERIFIRILDLLKTY